MYTFQMALKKIDLLASWHHGMISIASGLISVGAVIKMCIPTDYWL